MRSRTHSTILAVGLILLLSAIFLGVVFGLHLWKGIPFGDLTRDPATVEEFPFYIGFLSNVGIVLWASASAICLFSAWVVARRRGFSSEAWFILASGLITAFMLLDDLFMLHEDFLPYNVGLPEHLVYAIYGAIGVAYLIAFWRVIFKTEYPLLGLALLGLGLSAGLDAVIPPGPNLFLYEDGAKFIGIVSWLVYFVRLCARTLDAAEARGQEG